MVCRGTKNQFANKPRGLWPIRDNRRNRLEKTQIFGGGTFLPPFSPKKTFSNSSTNSSANEFHPDFDASFHADHDSGLGFFSSATVCWQINFVRLASQNHFLEKVDLF